MRTGGVGPYKGREGQSLLLEREESLTDLRAVLAAAENGSGSLALIEGPAGIGKTKLLQAASEQALLDGFECFAARAGELERGYPFGVVRQLFEPFLRTATDIEGLTEGAAALARTVFDPSEAEKLRPSPDPEFSRLHGLYWLLVNISERRPVCITVDDLQWADSPSAHFLSYLAARLDGIAVALICATRPSSREERTSRLSHPALQLIRPAPLSTAATCELVHIQLGDVKPEVCVAVREATGGNPFLVSELLRELRHMRARGEEIRTDRIKLLGPERIARAATSRIQHVGAKGVALAEAVAVLGDGSSLELAARLAEIEPGTASGLADELALAGVLSPGRPLSFAHPIVRQAVYEQIPYGRREVAHSLAAELLFETAAAPELVATQLLAAEMIEADWATGSLLEAADVALARGAPAVASTYLFRALAQSPSAATPGVLLKLGLAKVAEGEESASDYLQRAFDEATDPADRALAGLHLAFMLELGSRRLEALDVARQSLFIAGEAAPQLVPRLQGAVLLMAQSSIETRRRVLGDLGQAFELAERIPDPPAVLVAAISMERTIGDGDPNRGAALGAAALAGGLIEEVSADAPPVYLAVGSLTLAERFDEAIRWYGVALDDAAARGSGLGNALAAAFRAWTRVAMGDLRGAEADARSVLESVPEGFVVEPVAAASLAMSLALRGESAEALSVLDALDPARHETGHVLFQLARQARATVLVAAGQPTAAQFALEELATWEQEWGAAPEAWCQWRVQAALAHQALGETQNARRCADEAVEALRSRGAPGRLGHALRVRALVGERRSREKQLREARDLLASSKAPVEHAAVLVDLGAQLRRSGKVREAREVLTDGLRLAQNHAAITLVDRASIEAGAAGLKPRAALADGVDSLTPAERRVAELAASGKSNPEIAQALFVTRKTVETHLGSTYRKLGISSRAQLAPRLALPEREFQPAGLENA